MLFDAEFHPTAILFCKSHSSGRFDVGKIVNAIWSVGKIAMLVEDWDWNVYSKVEVSKMIGTKPNLFV